MTPENTNKNNFENNETPKVTPEKVEQKEISQEEFSNWADNEKESFKNESAEGMEKSNSINLDDETFEKIKNETGVEKELSALDKEAEQYANEAKNENTSELLQEDSKKYEERLMGSLVALTGGKFNEEFGHDASIDEKGYIVKADGTKTNIKPSMLDYYAEVKKNGGMSPDELRKNISEEIEWEKNGKQEEVSETKNKKSEIVEEEKIENSELSQEEQNEEINKNLEKIEEEIVSLEENSPDELVEKDRLEELKAEQKVLEKQKRESLIRQEKQKILEEKLDELNKQFEDLDPKDFESVLKTGKISNGQNIESKSMGSLEPENAQFLAKAFREGIKINLLIMLQALPELLNKINEDLTKQATEEVDKKQEEEKQKLEEEKKKEEEQKKLESEANSNEVIPEQKPIEDENTQKPKV